MILSGPTIRRLGIITPHEPRSRAHGMSYGESYAGYDIRVAAEDEFLVEPFTTTLAVSMEHFTMPRDVLGRVTDKSTWARRGLQVQNTVIEPGWRGWLTLELSFLPLTGDDPKSSWIMIPPGCPIAQVIFERIDCETEGYSGKYQDQPAEPVPAIMEVKE